MKESKQVVSLLLYTAMAASVITDCGSRTEETTKVAETRKTGTAQEQSEEAAAGEVPEIAILLPGFIADKLWNQSAYEGLKELEFRGYGVIYTEDVQAVGMESTFRSYYEEGYDFVIRRGVRYGGACVRAAEDYLEKCFFITGNPPEDEEAPSNIAFYGYGEYEGAYVCSVLAAVRSQNDIIGYVGGEDNSTQASDKNALVEGVKAARPDMEVKTVITGTFNDSSEGRETALTMTEQGVDAVLQTCDEVGFGAFGVYEERGVFCTGYTPDQTSLVEGDLHFTSPMVSVPTTITSQIGIINADTSGGFEDPGLKEDVISAAPYSSRATDETKATAGEAEEEIISGKTILTPNYNSS